MIDIGRSKMKITCRICEFKNSILLKQVKLKDVVICRGCKSNIQLTDYMNSYRIAERKIKKQIRQLKESLKRFH